MSKKMKLKIKSGFKKRLRLTKKGKVKKLQAARSHLKRNKRKRSKVLQELTKTAGQIRKLIGQ